MSPSSYPPEKPPVAELAEGGNSQATSTKSNGWMPCFVLLGLFGFLFTGICLTVWFFLVPDVEIVSEDERRKRNEEKYEAISDAFSGNTMQEQNYKELRTLNQFFKKVADVSDFSVKPELKQIVDYDRYARVMRKQSDLGALAYFGNALVAAMLKQQVIGPTPFSEVQIYRIQKLSEEDRLVYTQITGEYGDDMPYLFWVNKGTAGWKLYDWEHVRYGIRETEEMAAILGDTNPRSSRDYDTYINLYDDYSTERPDESYSAEKKRVRDLLRLSENLTFHKRLAAPYRYDIAHRYWLMTITKTPWLF